MSSLPWNLHSLDTRQPRIVSSYEREFHPESAHKLRGIVTVARALNPTYGVSLRDRRLARIVKRCQDLPGQEVFQYRSETGELATTDSADVNGYLREISGEEFTAKDFLTWHGTGHMAQLLNALGPGSSETRRKRNIVEAVKETAKHLGNRPAACRKYYIRPAVLEGYEEQTLFAAMGTKSKQASSARSGLRPLRSPRSGWFNPITLCEQNAEEPAKADNG
jgi:DNA topoisomerase IB